MVPFPQVSNHSAFIFGVLQSRQITMKELRTFEMSPATYQSIWLNIREDVIFEMIYLQEGTVVAAEANEINQDFQKEGAECHSTVF